MAKKALISVVVYIHKYHKNQPCFEALKNQTYKNFELIVVDATDGVSKARNEGIEKAKADIIVFTEADAIPANNWVEKILVHMKNEFGITGRVVHPRNDIFRTITLQFYPGDQPVYVNFDVLRGGNMAFRKEVFEEIGLFDESIKWAHNEVEFAIRYLRKYKLKYCPDVICKHLYARSLSHYLKKQFLFGRGSNYLWQKQGLDKRDILRRMIPKYSGNRLGLYKLLGRFFVDAGIIFDKIWK